MSDETRRVLDVFVVAATSLEAAIDARKPFAEVMELDAEARPPDAGGVGPGRPPAESPPAVTAARIDASGVALSLPLPPRRIVSLIPSTTETLCRLGLADALVGVTVYCVEPREVVATKTRIGGEKNPDLDKIRALAPDLVIANIEENLREHVATLRGWGIPVWVTYPRTVAGLAGDDSRAG